MIRLKKFLVSGVFIRLVILSLSVVFLHWMKYPLHYVLFTFIAISIFNLGVALNAVSEHKVEAGSTISSRVTTDAKDLNKKNIEIGQQEILNIVLYILMLIFW